MKLTYFVVLVFWYVLPTYCFAQLGSSNTSFNSNNAGSKSLLDSTKVDKKKLEEIYNNDYQLVRVYRPFEIHKNPGMTDSSDHLSDFNNQNFWIFTQTNQGNSFSTPHSLLFNRSVATGAKLGFQFLHPMLIQNEDDPSYHTNKPVTDIYYCTGTKLEQSLKALMIINPTKWLNTVIRFDKFNSPGMYSGSKTNHTRFSISGNGESSNRHWQIDYKFRTQNFQFFENGGVLTDTLYQSPRYQNRRLLPVQYAPTNLQTIKNSSNWLNEHNYAVLGIETRYVMGPTYQGYNKDSTNKTYTLVPQRYFALTVEDVFEKFNSLYKNPDSLLLDDLGHYSMDNVDTLIDRNRLRTLTIGLKAVNRIKIGQNEMALTVRVDAVQSRQRITAVYNSIKFGTQLSYLNNNTYAIADLDIFAFGSFAGNYNFKFEGQIPWKKGVFNGQISSVLAAPGLLYTHWSNNVFGVSTNLNNELVQQVSIGYHQRNWSLGFAYFSEYNRVYLKYNPGTVSTYHNFSQFMNMLDFKLAMQWEISEHWEWDNSAILQIAGGKYPISFPQAIGSTKFYFKKKLFNTHLGLRTGIQLDISSPYKNMVYETFYNDYAYNPSSNSSSIQLNLQYFVNFEIERAKFFISASQLNKLFLSNYNINYSRSYSPYSDLDYLPSQDVILRFGLDWLMIN